MAKKLYEESSVQAIANAIRAKNGSTDTYKIAEMPAAISAIETGGGSLEDDVVTHSVSGEYSNDRITTVGKYAFYECLGLTAIDMPNVTTLSTFAFQKCSKLADMNLPKVNYLAEGVFYGTAIANADFPLVTYVGSNCFYGASELTAVNLPLTSDVLEGTFRGSGVQTADLGATRIARTAFTDVATLETLILRATTVCVLADTVALRGSKIANGTGYIYVPDELVDSYKAATNWVALANQIKPISALEAET